MHGDGPYRLTFIGAYDVDGPGVWHEIQGRLGGPAMDPSKDWHLTVETINVLDALAGTIDLPVAVCFDINQPNSYITIRPAVDGIGDGPRFVYNAGYSDLNEGRVTSSTLGCPIGDPHLLQNAVIRMQLRNAVTGALLTDADIGHIGITLILYVHKA